MIKDANGRYVDMDELGFIINIEYDADSLPLYIGYSNPNAANAAPRWMIVTFTYDTNGNMLTKRFAQGKSDFISVWNDRATYTYA